MDLPILLSWGESARPPGLSLVNIHTLSSRGWCPQPILELDCIPLPGGRYSQTHGRCWKASAVLKGPTFSVSPATLMTCGWMLHTAWKRWAVGC